MVTLTESVDLIREATPADLDKVVELGRKFLHNGVYGGVLMDNPAQAKGFAELLIKLLGKVLLFERDGEVVGLIAFIVFKHFFSGEPYAQEVIWYVEPEHRVGGTAIKLLWEAEKVAKGLGVKSFQFTAPTVEVGRVYERFGYRQLEVAYQKELV